ncbi:MAG: OmpA family protein, partial [Bacteroidetes bacterium]|nr:OmpA family protein [Bacteroidota bacterium]
MVRIQGKVIDAATKEPVQADITYEKLPNYDDMGITRSNRETGEYKLYMLHDGNYRIKISASGYPNYTEEITVIDEDADGILEKNFELASSGIKHEIIRLENLLFARGRADISPSSHSELDELAKMMKERQSIRIQLEGHTDFQGNEQKNLELSQARVESVRDYLVDKGVSNKRILLKAFGGAEPLTRE